MGCMYKCIKGHIYIYVYICIYIYVDIMFNMQIS